MAHHVNDVTLEPENYTTPGDVTFPPQVLLDLDEVVRCGEHGNRDRVRGE